MPFNSSYCVKVERVILPPLVACHCHLAARGGIEDEHRCLHLPDDVLELVEDDGRRIFDCGERSVLGDTLRDGIADAAQLLRDKTSTCCLGRREPSAV
jgi:hypothetical protein